VRKSESAISSRPGNLNKLNSQKEIRDQPKLSRVTSVRYHSFLVVDFEIIQLLQHFLTQNPASAPGEAFVQLPLWCQEKGADSQ